MSRKFDSRNDSHSTKLKESPQIFVKLRFRELCDWKLPGLHPFDMPIINRVKNRSKQKGRLRVHKTPILEVVATWH